MKQLLNRYGIVFAIIVMALTALLFFYPDNVDGNVLQQHDMQQGIANGHEIAEYAGDSGDTPRWTGALFSGMPTFQIDPSYPGSSLFTWLNTVYGLGLPAPSNILMMMMLGMFILLSVMKLRWYYALTGALAWGLSSYFVIIIGAGHIWKFVTLAYVPPVIAGLILAYRGQFVWGAAVTALFTTLQIAANHVQMTYYFGLVMLAIVIAYAVDMIRRGQWRRWTVATVVVLAGGSLGVLANLPSLYNTYMYARETIRGGSELSAAVSEGESAERASGANGGLDMEYLTQYSYGRGETLTLLIPDIKGGASARPVDGQMQMLSIADLDADGDKAYDHGLDEYERMYVENYVTQYFGEPESTNGPVYVGAVIFALFVLGCFVVRGPLKWAMLVMTLLSICLAWGRNFMSLTELFVDIVPMYSQFRTPESILVIAEFCMPVLGILALHAVLTAPDPARYRRTVLYTFGGCALICLVAAVAPRIMGDPISEGDILLSWQIQQAYADQGADPQLLAHFSIDNPRIAAYVSDLRLGMVRSDAIRSLIYLLLGGTLLVIATRGKGALRASGLDQNSSANQTNNGSPVLLSKNPRPLLSKKTQMAIVAGICVLVIADLYSVDKRYISSDSFTSAPAAEPIAATEADRAILADTDINYRVLDIPRFSSADPSYYHKTIGGYHAAKLSRYQDLIDRQIMRNNAAVLDMLNTRYIVTGPSAADVQYNPYAMGNAWFVPSIRYVDGADAEMAALDDLLPAAVAVADRRFADILGQAKAVAPGDTIYETAYAPDRLTYRYTSAAGGLAVFSEIYFPWGWHATVDGTPVEIGRVNYILRAISLPAGTHEVSMVFDPESIHTTGTVAIIAGIIIYLLIALAAGILTVTVVRLRRDDTDTKDETKQ